MSALKTASEVESRVVLRLHRHHVESAEGHLEVQPFDLGSASDEDLDLLERLASMAMASVEVTVRIEGGFLELVAAADAATPELLMRVPLSLAVAFRVGEAGIVVVPMERESSASDCESDESSEDLFASETTTIDEPARSTSAWLLVVDSKIVAQQAMVELARQGALRSDFNKEYNLEAGKLGSGVSADVRRALPARASGALEVGGFGAAPTPVAVKCYKESTTASVMHEVAMFVALQGHSSIMAFIGAFALPGSDLSELPSCVVAMELCSRDLFTEVCTSGAVSEFRAKSITIEVLGGLRHMHSRGIIHRDIKPENIMIREDESTVIADFGLAVLASDEVAIMKRCGSPGFASPEVLRGEGASYRSDIFGLGSTLYFMLGARHAFPGDTLKEKLAKTQIGIFKFRGEKFESVSPAAKKCIRALLEGDVDRRPEAAEALEHPWFRAQATPAAFLTTPWMPVSDLSSEVADEVASSVGGAAGSARSASHKKSWASGSTIASVRDALPRRLFARSAAAAITSAESEAPVVIRAQAWNESDGSEGQSEQTSSTERPSNRRPVRRPKLPTIRLRSLLARATTAARTWRSEDRVVEVDVGLSAVVPGSPASQRGDKRASSAPCTPLGTKRNSALAMLGLGSGRKRQPVVPVSGF